VLCAQPCAAQVASGGDDQDTREAIVVTAQRRPEQAHDVPISLTVRSGDDLDRLQATDMAALGKIVPSLVMMRTAAFTQPYIRGIGKRSTLGVENSVATYMDGVYLASSISGLLDLRGIDRIEVLNGPQGTLFGRNATGGVIQVVTRDPTPERSGEAMLHVGDYGYVRGDLYLNGGDDRLAGNLAISLSHIGGYGTNLYTGTSDEGEVDHSLVARTKVIWRPDAPVRLTLAADYQDIDQNFSYRTVDGYPSISPPRMQDFRDGDQDAPNYYRFRYGGVSLRADAEAGPLTLMSLTALRGMHARYAVDLDRGPLPLLAADPLAKQDQFSQEFQLQSSDAAPVGWVAGVYYIHLYERYAPTPFDYGGSYSARLGGRVRQTLYSSGKTSSYATYGQATLPLDQTTALALGLRYTIEHRSVEANGEQRFDNPPFVRPIPGLPPLTEEPLRDEAMFRELTWRASLERHLSDEVMGYASASRGFQSGGWNLQTPQNPAFGPEQLDDFEVGLKYADRTGRLVADANVFYYVYSDLQVSAFTAAGSSTTNAASADVYGLELQFDARPSRDTHVTLGLQWLEARFNRFPNATCTNYSASAAILLAPVSCDVTGKRLPFAPELKLNAGASQQIALGGASTLLLSGNLTYSSGYFAGPDNVVRQTSFATVDASVEWRADERAPSVRFWVLNLTDTRYFNSLATMATVGVFQSPAAPRRFGISVMHDF
jgi:outer membrane receptor protein involved in Fe transport